MAKNSNVSLGLEVSQKDDSDEVRVSMAAEGIAEGESYASIISYDPEKLEYVDWPGDGSSLGFLVKSGQVALSNGCQIRFRQKDNSEALTFKIEEAVVVDAQGNLSEPKIVSSSQVAAIPARYTLSQNYPNPFNSVTTIRFDLPEKAFISLVIYNLSGQKVRTLVHGVQQSGHYTVGWNGRDEKDRAMASGVYLYRLGALDRGFVEAKRMLLLR